MTHTYEISGMTCSGCEAKVKNLLGKVNGVTDVQINLEKGEASISMSHHVSTTHLQGALKDYPKYQLKKKESHTVHAAIIPEETEERTSWFVTYKPILLIFGYILGITLLIEAYHGSFRWDTWMNHFMAGFFLAFSFFKMLDLKGFAESYFSYDIIARRWMGWGYAYAFIELALGLAYLFHINPLVTNAVTFIVMSISIIGVLKSVFNKRKIKCACLGAVFNLPMSTVTIIEDALMIVMSGIMFISML
jgi:copper chaperone CopZ